MHFNQIIFFNLNYVLTGYKKKYKNCSHMNASSFIAFYSYMLRQNVILFWKELFVAFKMASNIKKHTLYFSSYRPLFKSHYSYSKVFLKQIAMRVLVHVRI